MSSVVYTEKNIYTNFIVIGAGGTGSRVIQQLAQLISSVEWVARLNPKMYIFDADVVEEKNCARQLFTKNDIGKNKATVVAERYSKAFNIPITAFNKFVDDPHDIPKDIVFSLGKEGYDLKEAIELCVRPTIAILAVDSMEARRKCLVSLMQWYNPMHMVILDPGNEDTFGQVSVFHPLYSFGCVEELYTEDKLFRELTARLPNVSGKQASIEYIPFPFMKYFMGKDGVGTRTCADLDQTLALNSQAASSIVSMVQCLLYRVPLDVHTARFSITLNNSCEPMNLRWLKGVLNEEDPNYINLELLSKEFFDLPTKELRRIFLESDEPSVELKKKLRDGVQLTESQWNLVDSLIPSRCFDLYTQVDEIEKQGVVLTQTAA